MDIVGRVERHPAPGETIQGKNFLYVPGGKGSNQAIAAHRLGGKVQLLGKLGKDIFGKCLMDFYKKEGMGTKQICFTNDTPSGAAFVAVDSKGENMIYVSAGANAELTVGDVQKLTIKKGDIVSATLETPMSTTKYAFQEARKQGAITVLNAAPARKEARTLIPFTDFLIVNETELSFFSGIKVINKAQAIAAMKKLQKGKANIITTLGKDGVVALVGKEVFSQKAFPAKVVDTTGAGDCFVGAFITKFQTNRDIKEAMRYASAAAALSVQRLGASSSMPRKREVQKFLEKV
jgi:ribokinase